MRLRTHLPSEPLAPFVALYRFVESDDDVTRTLFPEPGLVIGLRWSGSASLVEPRGERRISDAALTGVLGAVRRIHTSRGGALVTIVFREGGAAPFFDVPLHELHGRTLGLDDLLPRRELVSVCDALGEAEDDTARVAVVERFLLALRRSRAIDPLVRVAAGAIRQARGALRIGDLAGRLGVGQDALEKRFRRAVGATPKQLATLLRVSHARELAKAGTSWTQAALAAGYFDQAHFIRDFRGLAGLPPARFFREVESC